MHDENAISRVIEALRDNDRFVVAAHASPDGDAMGSTAAMGWILRAMGKDFRLYNVSGLPDIFDWLEFPGPVSDSLDFADGFKPSAAIILDSGNLARVGDALAALAPSLDAVVDIDHHMDNPGYGTVNWVNKGYAAVGEMIAELAKVLDLPLTGPLGEAVYLALVADTGYFRYDNTRPETMELGASIIRQGLNPGLFSARYVNQWKLGRLHLWAEVLGQTRLFCDGRAGLLPIPLDARRRTGTTDNDCDGLVDYVRRLKGVQIAGILREDAPGVVKFSLRSSGNVNVQPIAASFGGGGHRNASGAIFNGTLEEAHAALLKAVCLALREIPGPDDSRAGELNAG